MNTKQNCTFNAIDRARLVSGLGFQHTNEPDKDKPGKNLCEYMSITWEEIVQMVDSPMNKEKSESQWFIPSTLMSRNSTEQRQGGEFFALWADLDKNNHPIENLAEFLRFAIFESDFEIYTTKSATADLQRCRILIPLEAPMNPSDWMLAQCLLNDKLCAAGFEADRSSQRLSQICNLPNRGEFYDTRSSRCGKRLSPDEDWKEELKTLKVSPPMVSKDDAWLVSPTPPPLVQLFNQCFKVEQILTDAGYDQRGNSFKHPASESGSYSASIKDDRVHAMSSNDPLYTGGGGGGAHDAYSAFAVLMANNDSATATKLAKEKLRSAGIKLPTDTSSRGRVIQNFDLIPISFDELGRAKLTPRIVLQNYLYADVRTVISAGGMGKTTLALFEAITLALQHDLWGRTPEAPVKTVLITHEDDREILVARMRDIMNANFLGSEEVAQVLTNIRILDVSGTSFRLSCIESDVVAPDADNIYAMMPSLKAFAPDWIIFDPLVSFGVGESRVNDAEQGLINAFRIFRKELDCCVQGIHHTGKANAREKTLDQYSGRGGSALPDGSRMVTVIHSLDHSEWLKQTSSPLKEGESGLVMHLAKLSYCPPQAPIYIRRNGYLFTQENVTPRGTDEIRRLRIDKLLEHIQHGYAIGVRYSKNNLEELAPQLGLTRKEVREYLNALSNEGSVIYHGSRGKSGAHYEPKEPVSARIESASLEVDNDW